MITSRHFTITEITDGVYALIATEKGGGMSNAGLIDMGEYSIVFDTFNTPQAGEDLRIIARQLIDKPIKYVINSHWHGDHVRGNQSFTEEVIISSKKTRQLIIETQNNWLNRMKPLLPKLDQDIDKLSADLLRERDDIQKNRLITERCFLEELRESIQKLIVTFPEVTYDKSLRINGSDRSVEILSMGKAHTECDSILYLPQDSIIFAGDIVSTENHPLISDGNHLDWLCVLDAMENMGDNIIVPGHGPIKDSGYLPVLKQYFKEIMNLCEEGLLEEKEGFDINQVQVPYAYSKWGAESVFYRNIDHLVKNITNKPD